METFVNVITEHLGPWWLLGLAAIYIALDKTGAVQRLFGTKSRADRLSEDTQRLVDNLSADAVAQRNRRIEDSKWYEGEIRRWRAELDEVRGQLTKALDTISSQERGNARTRHALNNVLMSFGGLREHMRKRGLEVPPYTGLKTLLELGYDNKDLELLQ